MLRKKTLKIKGPSGKRWKDITICQDGRYGAPGEGRRPKEKATPEQIARQNHMNRVRKIWQMIRGNFTEGDRWVTVTYRKGERPDWETAVSQMANLRRRITGWFRKRGIAPRMMYSVEHGSKGGIHMHLILGNVEGENIDRILEGMWSFGRIQATGLYAAGDFQDLAEYMAKGEKYGHTRGLQMPEAEKPRIITRADLMDYPKLEKGWNILESSITEGVNPVTGSPYLRYTLVQEPPKKQKGKRKSVRTDKEAHGRARKGKRMRRKEPPG